MEKLGERNYTLLSEALKTTGTCNPDECLYVVEESLYVDEIEEITKFLHWCHVNDKPFGHGNYEERFKEFKGSNKKKVSCFAEELQLFAKEANLKVITLKELKKTECDEVFMPPNIMESGHDDVREVWDYAIDNSWVMVQGGREIPTTESTLVLVR